MSVSPHRTRLATLMLFVGAAVALHAEGRCPPGFYPTGGGSSGWLGCAPMGPGAGGQDSDDSPRGRDGLPRIHYDAAQWAQWVEESKKAEAWREAERMKDPAYRKLKLGYWEFGSGANDPRKICIASFLTGRGGVLLMDWAGPQKGTALAYFGGAIPAVPDFRKLKVSLKQSGETQTVQAFHAPFPWEKRIGMILFAVPSTEALIAAIEDRQDFEVTFAGGSLISGEWHSGLEARDKLRACVAAR